MSERVRHAGPTVWLSVALAAWAVTIGGALMTAADRAAGPPQAPPRPVPCPIAQRRPTPPRSQQYVGEAKCLECHDDQRRGYEGSPHHGGGPAIAGRQTGCESCHGPGSAHVDDPAANPVKNFNRLPPGRSTRRARRATTAGSTRSGTAASTRRAVVVHDLSQRARPEIRDRTAEGEDAGRSVRHLSPRQDRQARSLRPHAGARRQDECTTCHNVARRQPT